MNWLDIALIVTVALGSLAGLWIGLIRAGFTAIGIIAGVVIMSHFKADASGWLANYISNEAVATIVAYAVLLTVTFAIGALAGVIVRKIFHRLYLGWADRLAGLAMGAAASLVLVVTAAVGVTNLTYESGGDGGYTEGGIAQKVLNSSPEVIVAKDKVQSALEDSKLVSILVGIGESLPSATLSMIPGDAENAIRILGGGVPESRASVSQ